MCVRAERRTVLFVHARPARVGDSGCRTLPSLDMVHTDNKISQLYDYKQSSQNPFTMPQRIKQQTSNHNQQTRHQFALVQSLRDYLATITPWHPEYLTEYSNPHHPYLHITIRIPSPSHDFNVDSFSYTALVPEPPSDHPVPKRSTSDGVHPPSSPSQF